MKRHSPNLSTLKAFTIVELMVSLVLAGIIVAGTFLVNTSIRNSRTATDAQSDFRQLQMDLRRLFASQNTCQTIQFFRTGNVLVDLSADPFPDDELSPVGNATNILRIDVEGSQYMMEASADPTLENAYGHHLTAYKSLKIVEIKLTPLSGVLPSFAIDQTTQTLTDARSFALLVRAKPSSSALGVSATSDGVLEGVPIIFNAAITAGAMTGCYEPTPRCDTWADPDALTGHALRSHPLRSRCAPPNNSCNDCPEVLPPNVPTTAHNFSFVGETQNFTIQNINTAAAAHPYDRSISLDLQLQALVCPVNYLCTLGGLVMPTATPWNYPASVAPGVSLPLTIQALAGSASGTFQGTWRSPNTVSANLHHEVTAASLPTAWDDTQPGAPGVRDSLSPEDAGLLTTITLSTPILPPTHSGGAGWPAPITLNSCAAGVPPCLSNWTSITIENPNSKDMTVSLWATADMEFSPNVFIVPAMSNTSFLIRKWINGINRDVGLTWTVDGTSANISPAVTIVDDFSGWNPPTTPSGWPATISYTGACAVATAFGCWSEWNNISITNPNPVPMTIVFVAADGDNTKIDNMPQTQNIAAGATVNMNFRINPVSGRMLSFTWTAGTTSATINNAINLEI